MESPVLTREEAAAYLKISTRQLDRLPIGKVKIGRATRFMKTDIDTYLLSQRRAPQVLNLNCSAHHHHKRPHRYEATSGKAWKAKMLEQVGL